MQSKIISWGRNVLKKWGFSDEKHCNACEHFELSSNGIVEIRVTALTELKNITRKPATYKVNESFLKDSYLLPSVLFILGKALQWYLLERDHNSAKKWGKTRA